MSAADPFLPVPDPGAATEASALPADDRLELDRVEDGSETKGPDVEKEDVARPARFVTPAPADAIDSAELRRDLGLD